MAYQSLEEILDYCEAHNREFCEAVMDDDCQERAVTEEESRQQIYAMWGAMLLASTTYEGNRKSASGLVGGQGLLMREYVGRGETLCGDFIGQVIVQALGMGEPNACVKRIVAAPTAGSCGVLPAILIPYYKTYNVSHQAIIKSLYVAAGTGQVIAARAFIAGAAGGCQAEIGSASSMAARAMVALRGDTNQQIVTASAIALKCLLGLVCDPVAGPVEVPCMKRNAMGAVNALTAADMALAGIVSAIPADQVINAMRGVGEEMHPSLRETSEGGLAVTPAATDFTSLLKSRK